jgi:hypothetical protein
VFLQAGLTLHALELQSSTLTARFGGEPGRTFYLERSTALGAAAGWETVAGPLRGDQRMQSLTDAAPADTHLFYRLRTTVP